MSWELTIQQRGSSVVSLAAVRQVIASIFPSARFGSEPSGADKIKAAEAQGISFPSFLRETMLSQPAKHGAECEVGGLYLRFHFGSDDLVRTIGIEVRGSGDPLPLLHQLVAVEGWLIIDDATGRALTADTPASETGWQTYQKILDQARDHT